MFVVAVLMWFGFEFDLVWFDAGGFDRLLICVFVDCLLVWFGGFAGDLVVLRLIW